MLRAVFGSVKASCSEKLLTTDAGENPAVAPNKV